MSKIITGAAFVAAAALLLTGCGGEATADAPTTRLPALPTVTLSAEEQAVSDAKEAYQRAIRVDDEISSNLTNPLDGYDAVATGPALVDVKYKTGQQREQTIYYTGATEIVSMEPIEISLAYEPNAKPPKIPVVSLRVCIDLSNSTIHQESSGKVENFQKTRQSALVDVVNEPGLLADKGSWRVFFYKETKKPC